MVFKRLVLIGLLASISTQAFGANMLDPRSLALMFAGFHMTKYGCEQLAQNAKTAKENQEVPTSQKIKNAVINLGLISSGLGLILTAPHVVTYVDDTLGTTDPPTNENYYCFLGGMVASVLLYLIFKP